MKPKNLAGYTVVLTGATSGIGRATAQALAREKANLVLAARREAVLDEVAGECQALGAQTLVVPTDVTNPQALQALARAAAARFGGIDVWINNVGVGAVGAFTDTPLKAHQRVIESNLIGHMNGAHTALPYFIGQQSGVLINMLSLGAWAAAPYATAYSASKFGLRGFSEALRGELTRWPDIHVCDVFPAFMDTPGMAHAANYSGKQLRPMPPLYDPRLVARAVVALVKAPQPVTTVGAAAHAVRLGHAISPWLSSWLGAKITERYFRRAESAPRTDGNLFAPSIGSAIDGGYRGAAAGRKGLGGKLVPLLGAAVAGGLLFVLATQRGPRGTRSGA
jgi:short-subunit dehydrogenase